MRIRLTDLAQADLESVQAHVAPDTPTVSVDQVLRVLDSAESLEEYPNLGRAGRVPGTRELVVGGTPYLVIYQVHTSTLWVLCVLHHARRWPPPG